MNAAVEDEAKDKGRAITADAEEDNVTDAVSGRVRGVELATVDSIRGDVVVAAVVADVVIATDAVALDKDDEADERSSELEMSWLKLP